MSEKNVVDLVADKVLEQFGTDVVDRVVEQVRPRLETEAEAILTSLVDRAQARIAETLTPATTPPDSLPSPKADAKDRAWRTLVQGIVATILLAGSTAVGTALTAPEFDLLTWDSWKAAGAAAGTAVLMAILAYVQRLIQPPKER